MAAALFGSACQKEDIDVFTPIYEAGNQEYGWCAGFKNGLSFEASAVALQHLDLPEDYFFLHFTTFTEWEGLREFMVVGEINYETGVYPIKEDEDHENGIPEARYTTLSDDGDVVEDRYDLDAGKDNWIEITAIDTVDAELVVSGKYNIHFKIRGDHAEGSVNPDKVSFTDMIFETRFRQ